MALSVTVRHSLGREVATQRIKQLLPQLKQQHAEQMSDAWEEWSGSSARFGFRTSGFNISGTLAVTDNSVTISGSLPFLASMFSGQIEDAIRSEATKLLT